MTPLAIIFWAAEFSLEAFGACLSLRRRSWLLFALFSFLAATDLILLGIRIAHGQFAYAWASWGQQTGRALLLSVLACYIVGKMVREWNSSNARIITVAVTALVSGIVVKAFSDGVTIAERLLDAAMMANLCLLVVLALGCIGRRGYLTRDWQFITAGLLLLISSDLLFTFLWTFWEPARHLYPVGVIPAYGMWNWAMWKESGLNTYGLRGAQRETGRCGELPSLEQGMAGPEWVKAFKTPPLRNEQRPEITFSERDEDFLKDLRITV